MMARDEQQNELKTPLIGLSTGGTGGHIFPAVALARNLLGKGYRVVFYTDDRGVRFLDKYPDLAHHEIKAATISKKPIQLIQAGFKILKGYLQARSIMKQDMPHVIVAFGGYPCFPAAFAGLHLGVPLVLHEQNALMGRANRFLAKKASSIALSFEHTHFVDSALKNKATTTGNPIRPDLIGIASQDFSLPKKEEKTHLLVLGGSQGSHILGKIIPKAIALLPKEVQNQISITQQCRSEDMEYALKTYESLPVKVRLDSFIDDMPEQLKKAHLIISRAGASTVAELTAVGRPAIYVPLAASLDGDQSLNARQIVAENGGWLMEEKAFTADALSQKLQDILSDPEQLKARASAAKNLGRIDATESLADLVTRHIPDSRADFVERDV